MKEKLPCAWCSDELEFTLGRGWHHSEGGVYVKKCKLCGWRGAPHPEPTKCPACGSFGIVDAHIATPRRS